jgi:deoxyribodipyrimidine photo-lyase
MAAIWWIRRDFRLTDNTALHNARQADNTIIPLYIIDPALIESARNHGPRIPFMLEGLHILAADIEKHGGRLIVRSGKPEKILPEFAQETKADSIHFNRDYSPYALRRDAAITETLEAMGVHVAGYKDLVIHEAEEVLSKGEKPFSVYSPFRKVWERLPKPEALPRVREFTTPHGIKSESIPKASDYHAEPAADPIVEPGEAAAQERLDHFLRGIVDDYKQDRNIPGIDGTARISPYLRWGMLSPRQAYWDARTALEKATSAAARESVTTWINELIWREFFYQVLARNPHVVKGAYRPEFDRIRWQAEPDALQAWQDGKTGYPIVDAGMRQMNQTGWMHNRLRMITASFLCKDLLINWQDGERYFMQRLLDGDLAQNNGGWQWTAGTGTDAAPYFRVFNPTTQGEKFDPDGDYIRAYVPELKDVPNEYIHEPHKMPETLQKEIGCIIGKDYPAPMVEHGKQRERVLELYASVKG